MALSHTESTLADAGQCVAWHRWIAGTEVVMYLVHSACWNMVQMYTSVKCLMNTVSPTCCEYVKKRLVCPVIPPVTLRPLQKVSERNV